MMLNLDYKIKQDERIKMKVNKELIKAHKYGRGLEEKYPEWSLKNILEEELHKDNKELEIILEDIVAREFLTEGFLGQEIPKWVRGYRRGEIPEGGQSYNYRDQEKHAGVSIMGIIGEDKNNELAGMPAEIHELFFNDRKMVIVEGWKLSRKGADGESLLAGAIKIK